MKTKKLFIGLVVLIFTGFSIEINAQGCVAVQGMGCMDSYGPESLSSAKGDINITTSYRYFRSFRHFRGDVEEKHRVENNTEVINISHLFDLGLSYSLTNRLQINLNVPISIFDRSSLYEHYGNSLTANPEQKRFHTSASGIGDIRLSASYWIKDPNVSPTNLLVGLGIKAPTGNAHVMGDFHKLDEDGNDFTIRRPVDQSIQLGDGGWGIILESQGFHSIFNGKSALYFSGFYMLNPKEYNDVLRTPTSNPDQHWSYFSSPDQFGARVGIAYFITPAFNVGLGGLVEGVPATDLIGGSEGYRRPGYAVSVEPSLSYFFNDWGLNFSIPLAVYRNRIKSVWDKERGTHGDAAFADYSINVSLSYRLRNQ